MKTTVVMDIECYVDYFLVMFRSVTTGKTRHYELYDGHPLDKAELRNIILTTRVVTFNGLHYDMPMLTLALNGADCEALKRASNMIIDGNLRNWQFEKHFDIKVSPQIDHIDLMEVAPGVMVGLKQYGGRMHSQRLQDLPIEHTASIAPDQRQVLIDYCGNDLQTTIDLWHRLTNGADDVIGIRERIGAETKLELRSKSDAQVAEAVIKATVEKIKGERIYKPDILPGTSYQYRPPAFLKFDTPQMREVFADICDAYFIVKADGKIAEPAELAGRVVRINQTDYAMGIGGLHSCEKSAAHRADEKYSLIDRDVASFYPMLIKMCGLAPRNMGKLFLQIYSGWIDRRIAAKRNGEKTTAQTLKIFLNGIFGKLGSRYSIVFAPDLLIQVTLTGQLVLLMLIERIEAVGVQVVSANTDGIVIKCPRDMEPWLNWIIAEWERDTGLETEETRYRALYSRDINNYIALKEKGGSKTKGVFSAPGLQKNVENEICNEAAAAYLEHGTPVEDTILGCKDVRKFLAMRKVTGGATYGENIHTDKLVDGGFTTVSVVSSIENNRYLGKVVRWYMGHDKTKDIRRAKASKTGNFDKVAGSAGAIPMMDLIDGIPADLDHSAYIAEAKETLRSVGAI